MCEEYWKLWDVFLLTFYFVVFLSHRPLDEDTNLGEAPPLVSQGLLDSSSISLLVWEGVLLTWAVSRPKAGWTFRNSCQKTFPTTDLMIGNLSMASTSKFLHSFYINLEFGSHWHILDTAVGLCFMFFISQTKCNSCETYTKTNAAINWKKDKKMPINDSCGCPGL